jgi:hypothetical protein
MNSRLRPASIHKLAQATRPDGRPHTPLTGVSVSGSQVAALGTLGGGSWELDWPGNIAYTRLLASLVAHDGDGADPRQKNSIGPTPLEA